MRAFGLIAAPLVVAVTAGACASVQMSSPPRTQAPVEISARCTPNGVQATITPWVAPVGKGSDLEWSIAAGSDIDEVVIVQINDWPFNGAPPRVAKGNNGKGMSMKAQVKVGDRFHYGVSFTCPDGRRVIIDPDMIIVNAT